VIVHVEPIALEAGLGRLFGSLLCALLGGIGAPAPPAAMA
jgi:hypothetical protein